MNGCVDVARSRKRERSQSRQRKRRATRLLIGEPSLRGLEAILRDANAVAFGGDGLDLVGARANADRSHGHRACAAAKG
jgi:hypothetical protein